MGLAPLCPSARHLLSLPLWCPRGAEPLAALVIPAPGERTISNAEVPLPRSPSLLGCRHCSEESVSCRYGGEPRISAAGFLLGRDYKCRKQSNARGAGGGAPGKIKLESPPLPAGKGVGGMGAEKQAKGRGGRRQSSHAPRWARGSPPAPVPRGFRRGDARGEAPCIK